jgi:hypothetical protein
LVVATLLTLVFLPALYVAWFRIQPADAPRVSANNSECAAVAPQLTAQLPFAATLGQFW